VSHDRLVHDFTVCLYKEEIDLLSECFSQIDGGSANLPDFEIKGKDDREDIRLREDLRRRRTVQGGVATKRLRSRSSRFRIIIRI